MKTTSFPGQKQNCPEDLQNLFSIAGISSPTLLQKLALERGFFSSYEDWLIVAPTSSGKGSLAAAAAIQEIHQHKNVLWLTPTRSLAHQQAEWFGALKRNFGFHA
jgi:replicative superfamily II helicase